MVNEEYSDAAQEDLALHQMYKNFLLAKVLAPAIDAAELTYGRSDAQLRLRIAELQLLAVREAQQAAQVLVKNGLDITTLKKLKSGCEPKVEYYAHQRREREIRRELRELLKSLDARIFLKTGETYFRYHTIFKGRTGAAIEHRQVLERYGD